MAIQSHAHLLEEVSSNDKTLDLARSLVDLSYPGVSVVPLSWHVVHVAHTTQHLDCLKKGVKAEIDIPRLEKGTIKN